MSSVIERDFSWKKALFHGFSIVPRVRDQGWRPSCVFHALCAAAEIELSRMAALENRGRRERRRFLVDSFIKDYEKDVGAKLGKEHKPRRLRTGIRLFKEQGVLAMGLGIPATRIKVREVVDQMHLSFGEIKSTIDSGKPFIGSFYVTKAFAELKRDEIYDYKWNGIGSKPESHCVCFTGYGMDDKNQPYLEFLNSHGKGWADNGYDKVYLQLVQNLKTLEL